MRSADDLEVVDVVEVSRDFGAEKPTSSSGIASPRLDFFRVTPEKVSESAFERDFDFTFNRSDLVDRLHFW